MSARDDNHVNQEEEEPSSLLQTRGKSALISVWESRWAENKLLLLNINMIENNMSCDNLAHGVKQNCFSVHLWHCLLVVQDTERADSMTGTLSAIIVHWNFS